jgi:hypothetical protein
MSEVNYIAHHGIKGMKWGVRRYQRKDGTLTPAGKKRHNKDYTDKQRKNDRAFYGSRGEKRINSKLNEGYGLRGARHFEVERKERKEKIAKSVKKGAKKTGQVLGKLGMAYVSDQVFFNGLGTDTVKYTAKATIKTVGRTVVNAYVMARGGYDIHWYNN